MHTKSSICLFHHFYAFLTCSFYSDFLRNQGYFRLYAFSFSYPYFCKRTIHEKTSFNSFVKGGFVILTKQQKTPLTEVPSRTNSFTIRGATLICSHDNCTLSRIPTYPRQFTHVTTSQNTLNAYTTHLTVPSAAHLIICVSPDSQQHGLSVEA